MEDLRKKLDEIDSQLARLFDERMSVAADIARYKRCPLRTRSEKRLYSRDTTSIRMLSAK